MTARTRNHCGCGRVCSKYSTLCKRCSDKKLAEAGADAQKTVATGVCPKCGARLKRNSSMTGWWQCSLYGSEGFRADATKPACSFRCFT